MTVMLVEDDAMLRDAVEQALRLAGHRVVTHGEPRAALAGLSDGFDGVVVSDIRMPGMDGLAFAERVRALDADIPVILVTGHGDVAMAVRALHDGAFDFLTKPFATDHLIASVGRALERRALVIENRRLRALAEAGVGDGPLIGDSAVMVRLRATIRTLAAADVDVLIEGETGTGKEIVAHLLHRQGPRRGRPLIAVNCAALTADTAAIELFGHEADSVAHTRLSREGQIAAASGGTLLLDEIDSMPMAAQAALLRVLEEREVLPIGANRPRTVDLRVVATTKVDLSAAVAAGRFRADLFYRLDTVRLRVPPLRERETDAARLFAVFVEEVRAQAGRHDAVVGAAAARRLVAHDWPGNVRELRNFAYETVLGIATATPPAPPADLPTQVAAFEAEAIRAALARAGGRVVRALDELGIPRKTFYDKAARHGIDPADFRRSTGAAATPPPRAAGADSPT